MGRFRSDERKEKEKKEKEKKEKKEGKEQFLFLNKEISNR